MARHTVFSLLAPARAVMRRLALRDKLALVAVIALTPLLLVAWMTLSKVQDDVAFTRGELDGIAAVDAMLRLTGLVETHRHQAHLAASGVANAGDALGRVRADLPAAMDQVEQALPAALRASFATVRERLRELISVETPDGTVFARHAAPISALRMLILDAAEHSGLSLDPEGGAYFLMDLTVERHVPWSDTLSSARTLAMGLAARGEIGVTGAAEIAEPLRRLDERLALAARSAAAVIRAGARPPAGLDVARKASERFVAATTAAFSAGGAADGGKDWIQAGDEAMAAIEPFGHEALAALKARLDERAGELSRQRWLVAGVSCLAIALLAYLMAGLYTATVGTMAFMHRAVAETASGNLIPSAAIRGTDEFARTGEQLEKMNADLSVLIAGVRSNAVVVSNIGAALARGNADLSSQAEQQAGSLQATSHSLQAINETAARTAESVRSVDAHADRMRQTAEAGGAAMREAVEAIRAVEESATKIRDIIGLINGIAFQTNILALNAAVEAARAGEHGRGFAVVATEVRTLAQRSATAAGEIQGLVQRTTASVQLCSDRIAAVHGRLNEIVDGARGLADNTRTISTAAGEESESLRRIAQTMGDLDALTQRTSQMADTAREASTELQTRASQLNRALGIFRLRQGCADEAIALVERALPVAAHGSDAGLARLTADASLRDRDMYVFVFDREGIYRAVAGNASRVGVPLASIPGLDARQLVDDAFRVAERGGGWVDYRIVNPASGRTEPKTSYVVPLSDGLVLGCGIYRSEVAEA